MVHDELPKEEDEDEGVKATEPKKEAAELGEKDVEDEEQNAERVTVH